MSDYYPERIVCLTEEPTEILYLLGEEQRIVGISTFTVRPERAPLEKPKVSAFTSANIEKIKALEPDLVIGFSDIQGEIAKRLVEEGITVLINNHRSIKEILKMIIQTGNLVGKGNEAQKLVSSYEQKIATVKTQTASLKNKARVFFEEWPDPLISGIRWVSELIEIAGGIHVYDEFRTASMARDRIIKDPAELITKDPDIIIGSWCGKKFRPEKVRARKGWSAISAVKNNHLYEIDSSIILQPGPAALTDGLDELVRIISEWGKSKSTS